VPNQSDTQFKCKKRGRVGLKRLQAVLVVGSFQIVAFVLWGFVAALVAIVPGVICVMVINAVRGVRSWNACERDYLRLLHSGLSQEDALVAISESFRPDLSKCFHRAVVTRFDNLDAVVVFHTGPLLNEDDESEERCEQILVHTTMTRASGGRLAATTDWGRIPK